MRKKTRASRAWAADYDYKKKLSQGDADFLDKFTGEYYRNEFSDDPLHNTDEQRKELFDNYNAAYRDIFTANPQKVTEHRQAIPDHRPSIKCRFYFESDYRGAANNENCMVEAVDALRTITPKCPCCGDKMPQAKPLCPKCLIAYSNLFSVAV